MKQLTSILIASLILIGGYLAVGSEAIALLNEFTASGGTFFVMAAALVVAQGFAKQVKAQRNEEERALQADMDELRARDLKKKVDITKVKAYSASSIVLQHTALQAQPDAKADVAAYDSADSYPSISDSIQNLQDDSLVVASVSENVSPKKERKPRKPRTTKAKSETAQMDLVPAPSTDVVQGYPG